MKKRCLLLAVGMVLLSTILSVMVKAQESGQGVTDDSVLVGNSAAISGAYAPVGLPFNAGIQAYFDMVNSEGGIDGRQINFTHIDDEFDPAKGKAALQTLVEDEEVFAIVGHFGTPVVAATVQDLKNYGIPAVYFATGIGQLYFSPAKDNERNIFPVQPIYITEGSMMVARGVGNFGATNIGVIYTTDDAGKDMLKGAEEKAKELGVELYSEQVAAGATDVSAAVTSLLQNDVDFIIGASIQGTFPTIVKALAAQGNTADVITTYVNVDASIANQVYADSKDKFKIYGNGWVDLAAEKSQTNLALMNEWIADEYDNNVYAMTGWIAASFFTEGLRRLEGQELTWEAYIDAMESAPIENPFGGIIDYKDGMRMGTQEMNLSVVKDADTWEAVEPLTSIQEILGE